MTHGHTNIKSVIVASSWLFVLLYQWRTVTQTSTLLLLHSVGYLYYCINDARSHKHQICYRCIQLAVYIIVSMTHGHTNIKSVIVALSWLLILLYQWHTFTQTSNLLLLHPVGCLYYCINDARSHKHQICYCCIQLAVYIIVSMTHVHTNIKSVIVASSWLFVLLYQWRTVTQTSNLLLLHPVGCLYYCINDARSHKHKICYCCIQLAVCIIVSMTHGHTNINSVIVASSWLFILLSQWRTVTQTSNLLLLHSVGSLYYCINDARSHKHQICYCCIQLAVYIIVSMTHGHTNIKSVIVAFSWLFVLLYQ